MIFSKKSRYALRALTDLSFHSGDEHLSLNTIARRNNISAQYLEQVFASLRRADIVRSIKGPQGGYFLKRPAREITVADVVEALDGPYFFPAEDGGKDSEIFGITEAIDELVIRRVNSQLEDALTHVTLEDLVERCRKKEAEAEQMYYI